MTWVILTVSLCFTGAALRWASTPWPPGPWIGPSPSDPNLILVLHQDSVELHQRRRLRHQDRLRPPVVRGVSRSISIYLRVVVNEKANAVKSWS